MTEEISDTAVQLELAPLRRLRLEPLVEVRPGPQVLLGTASGLARSRS